MPDRPIGRRVFLAKSLSLPPSLALLATLLAQSCAISSTEDEEQTDTTGAGGDLSGDVSVAHIYNHTVTITGVQLSAAQDVTLTLTNSGSGHVHTVTFNAAQVAQIQLGYKVGPVTSSATDHSHGVTFYPARGTAPISDATGSISGNHSPAHTVTITAVELLAGGAWVLTLSAGDGDNHTHTVSLSSFQVGQIVLGNTVSATSSLDSGHTHGVTFA